MPSQLDRHSVFHVAGGFSPAFLETIAQQIPGIFNEQVAETDREKIRVAQGVASDGTRFNPLWNGVWRTMGPTLADKLIDYPCLSYPPQVRWIRQQNHLVPWHQDLAYVGHIGQTMTCFVPLNMFPFEHATLEFAEWTSGELPHEKDDVYNGFRIKKRFRKQYHFNLQRGDCLVFGDLAPHRTYIPEGAGMERMSLEFRLLKRDDLKSGKHYFDIFDQRLFLNQ